MSNNDLSFLKLKQMLVFQSPFYSEVDQHAKCIYVINERQRIVKDIL